MAQRVMVEMSGGVDSSVAALLLQQQGWQDVYKRQMLIRSL